MGDIFVCPHSKGSGSFAYSTDSFRTKFSADTNLN